VPAVSPADMALPAPAEGSAEVAARVAAARAIQTTRLAGTPMHCNAELAGEALDIHTAPDAEGLALLQRAAEKLHLSARGYTRVLRLARTVADLAGSAQVARPHIAEALSYRRQGA
ncbi:MAG TPA: ATP-binding protein, partial [Novosphingobium sp.]|nr:ATP-binding protein [Novosphingobium sp.]